MTSPSYPDAAARATSGAHAADSRADTFPGKRESQGRLPESTHLGLQGAQVVSGRVAAKPSPAELSKAQLPGSQGQRLTVASASLTPFPQWDQLRGGESSLASLFTGGQGALTTATGNSSHGAGRHRPTCKEQPPAKPVPVGGGPGLPPSTCLARLLPVHDTGQESTSTSLLTAVVQQAYHSPAFCSKSPAPRDPDARVSWGAAHGWTQGDPRCLQGHHRTALDTRQSPRTTQEPPELPLHGWVAQRVGS